MDQQFQQYEQFFKSLFEKVKGAVLPKADPKIRWRIVAFCSFIILSIGVPFFWTLRDYIDYMANNSAYVDVFLYPLIYSLIPFLAALICLFGLKIGWFILALWLIKRTLGSVVSLVRDYLLRQPLDSELSNRIDEIMGFSVGELIGTMVLFGGMSIYMHTKEFTKVYNVSKPMRLVPLILAVMWISIEYVFVLI